MSHRIHKNNSGKVNRASVIGALSIVALAAGGLGGCASASDASTQPKTPATQAAAIARTECGPTYRDDAQVAEILSGGLVEAAGPLYNSGVESNRSNPHLEGAAIGVRPLKGTSAEWLARALTCHGAEQTLAQGPARTFASDPFYLPDTLPNVHVRSAGDAFVVEVTAETTDAATEILARARALANVAGIARANVPERQMAVDLSQ
jgi:hypothetical protein